MSELGRWLMLFGVVLVAVGLLLTVGGKIPWLGRLPGDLYYKTDHLTFYFPIVTCVLISIIVSLLFHLFRR